MYRVKPKVKAHKAIHNSERKSDVRKLMKALRVMKDEERATNLSAKKSIAFQDLVNVKQAEGETFAKKISFFGKVSPPPCFTFTRS